MQSTRKSPLILAGQGALLVAACLAGCATAPDPGKPIPGAAEAVEAAVTWLVAHQDEDGRWDADAFMRHDKTGEKCDGAGNPVHDVGLTGLALLALLGHGNTMRTGPHKDAVKNAVKWLRSQQGDNGLFGTTASHDFIYNHAIATYAMCEAYGLSEYKTLKRTVQGGLNYLESHRNPYAVWRYQPMDGSNDSSITNWCVMAYCSGRDFGLDVNKNALKVAKAWYEKVVDPKTGRCGYTKRGELSSRHPGDHIRRYPVENFETLTAGGMLTRLFLGVPRKEPTMQRAAELLLTKPPKWADGFVDELYWFYGTSAMYQMGGDAWRGWRKHLEDALVKTQRTDGNARGSWDPIGVWGEDGGRVYATALLTLALESVYREAKLVRRP